MSDRANANDVVIMRNANIATVTLNRPPNNHANTELLRDLADALGRLDSEPTCRVIILAAAGKNFCAGANLSSAGTTANFDWLGPFYEQAQRLFAVRKPMVAAIQGSAVGAGLGLALVADFRVAASGSRFWADFVKLGTHPGFGLTYTLPRLIGPQRAAQMLLTGRRIQAAEALNWGLVDEVSPDEKSLSASACALAAEIAENAPLSVVATRTTLRQSLADAVRTHMVLELEQQTILGRSLDSAEGVRAVAERRAGRFIGR